MLITVKDNKDKLPSKMFSQSYKPLVEAFDKATPVIGDKAKKLFEDFAKECDIIYKKQQETFNTQHEKIKEQYRSGAIDWKKYNSLFKKLQKRLMRRRIISVELSLEAEYLDYRIFTMQ